MAFPFRKRNALPLHNKDRGAFAAAPKRVSAELSLTANAVPSPAEWRLYDALRTSVPIIDAAFRKIVRLCGGFSVTVDSPEGQAFLDRFCAEVSVNATGCSLQQFADQVLDSLLTYGNAVGEMLIDDESGMVVGLTNAHPAALIVEQDSTASCRLLRRNQKDGKPERLPHPERILFTALNPPAGGVYGVSVLRGLPAISRVLLRIFECIGQNYDRAGNVRYAVTYRPGSDPASIAYANEHAGEIAAAWQEGVQAVQNGEVRDFIVAGDVEIRPIGAEHQMPDTEIPVRQLLEQIVAKLSIPPFLLGLTWSSTERMSSQQADILTSELEYFRRLLTPLLLRIAKTALRGAGYQDEPAICWEHINLQDETELADARLKNAQAYEIELRNRQTESELRKDECYV